MRSLQSTGCTKMENNFFFKKDFSTQYFIVVLPYTMSSLLPVIVMVNGNNLLV